MDQRAVAINMVSMFIVLMLCVCVPCFFGYVRLKIRHRQRFISTRRYEMRRYRQKRVCNRMMLASIATVAIVWGGVELAALL